MFHSKMNATLVLLFVLLHVLNSPNCIPFQQSYLWQSVLGKLHWVKRISFIGHIMDRLATYWHLEKQYNAICSLIEFQVNIHKLHCVH